MRAQMTPTSLFLDLWHTNLESALSCNPISMKKSRFPPFLGNKHVIIESLRSNFASRRARWSQIGLSHKQVFIAALVDFGDLASVGYPLSIIYKAWHASFSHDPMFYVGLRTLQFFIRSKPRIGEPWHINEHDEAILLNMFGISPGTAL